MLKATGNSEVLALTYYKINAMYSNPERTDGIKLQVLKFLEKYHGE